MCIYAVSIMMGFGIPLSFLVLLCNKRSPMPTFFVSGSKAVFLIYFTFNADTPIIFFNHVHDLYSGHWKDPVKFGRSIIDSCMFRRFTKLHLVVHVCKYLLSLVVTSCHVLFFGIVTHACLLSFSVFTVKSEAYELLVVVAKLMLRTMFRLCICCFFVGC